MEGRVEPLSPFQEGLDLQVQNTFQQRFPWIGGDLQTLRDTFVSEKLPLDSGEPYEIPVPSLPTCDSGKGHLLAFLDLPQDSSKTRGLVLLLHGLGGSSRRLGLRRMGLRFLQAGFGVLRLNLRGADPGRHLAGGTYAAQCNSDLMPVIKKARQLCEVLGENSSGRKGPLPLFGAGISLGGTMLLNACLLNKQSFKSDKPLLDALICTSSPLDLEECSLSIERFRNSIYQRWLLKRLVRQTLADPFGVSDDEKEFLTSCNKENLPLTIRAFDSAITAPRWGYRDVNAYYLEASPLQSLCSALSEMPPMIFLQALDDPWVPAQGAKKLMETISFNQNSRVQVVLTKHGGHNGFHGVKGCWGDDLVQKWLLNLWFNCFK